MPQKISLNTSVSPTKLSVRGAAKSIAMLDEAAFASSEVFNPLKEMERGGAFVAESAVHNTMIGVCPKCSSPMTQAKIANGDDVFWCTTCCVTSPKPDNV